MFATDFGRWVRHDLFGGRGAVQVSDLLGPRAAAPFEAVLACELDPNGEVGEHHQAGAHEIVVTIEGRGRITVDRDTTDVVAGTVVFVKLGSVLSIENVSSEAPLRYLIVKASAPEGSPAGPSSAAPTRRP